MDERDCCICYKHTTYPQLCKTSCEHFFCETCLNQWFDKGSITCPVCRKIIKHYEQNSENIRLVQKIIARNQNEPSDRPNRYLRINLKLILLTTSLILSIGSCLIYMSIVIWNQYNSVKGLKHSVETCENRYTTYSEIRIMFNSIIKTCKIPQYFIENCFN